MVVYVKVECRNVTPTSQLLVLSLIRAIRHIFAKMLAPGGRDWESREARLEHANSDKAKEEAQVLVRFFERCDSEEIAPSAGLQVSTFNVSSEPDGNSINILFTRPTSSDSLPCVYYIHGGGMGILSCFLGNYRAWARMIVAQGVAVAMVDFRNALTPSSVPEVVLAPRR